MSSTPATALVEVATVTNAAALAVSAKVDRNDSRGTENIGAEDITLPRLAVAQKTSPQLEPDKNDYIDGLRLFEMYNSLTGERYGNGPVEIVVVRLDKKGMQFDKDNNVVDFDVPLDDPRLKFTTGPNGERIKPVATLFYNFVILIGDEAEPAVFSLKGTGVKTAKKLNSLIQVRRLKHGGPSWGGKYKVTSAKGQSGSFTYGLFNIDTAGIPSDEQVAAAEKFYESLKDRTVHTDIVDDDVNQGSDDFDLAS